MSTAESLPGLGHLHNICLNITGEEKVPADSNKWELQKNRDGEQNRGEPVVGQGTPKLGEWFQETSGSRSGISAQKQLRNRGGPRSSKTAKSPAERTQTPPWGKWGVYAHYPYIYVSK